VGTKGKLCCGCPCTRTFYGSAAVEERQGRSVKVWRNDRVSPWSPVTRGELGGEEQEVDKEGRASFLWASIPFARSRLTSWVALFPLGRLRSIRMGTLFTPALHRRRACTRPSGPPVPQRAPPPPTWFCTR